MFDDHYHIVFSGQVAEAKRFLFMLPIAYHNLFVLKLQHDARPSYLLTSTSEQSERREREREDKAKSKLFRKLLITLTAA